MHLSAIAAGAALLAACGSGGGSADDAASSASAWGTLNDDSLVPTSPQFLINEARGKTFRVCLPRYMSQALPGIESEIPAAINVWASYLGRTIPVTVDVKDLPRATADQSVDALGDAYQAACGAGYDVVMGFANLQGVNVGLTGVSYTYTQRADGTKQIVSFRRYLFLRDYDLLPSQDDDGNPEGWTSLAAVDGRPTDAAELLARMAARSDTRFVDANRYLVLPVLTHEYGHVWGLCDQYEGSTNCDPAFGSGHLVEGSIMGARGATERLYLTDDDVEGVRALASRPGFAHDWGAAPATPAAPIAQKPVMLARIESVKRDAAGALDVAYGVVTSAPGTYAFELSTDGRTWTPLSSDFESADPFDVPIGRLTISLGPGNTRPFQVRMIVTASGAAPVTVDAHES